MCKLMIFGKLFVCLVLVALSVEAEVLGLSGLYNNYHGEYAAAYDNYVPKPYAFEYGVSDPHTGDHKTQWETKDEAGIVRGSYSLVEPDGTTRIVDYVADDHGFRAVVKKISVHGHSIESHGGAVAAIAPIQPIVVPDFETVPVHLEHQVPVVQTYPQEVHVEQSVPLHQPIHAEQSSVFQSYDGGAEHYLNLIQHQQPLPAHLPKAEGIYVESPRPEISSYLQAPAQLIHATLPSVPRPEIHLQQRQPASVPLAVPNTDLYYTQYTEVGNPQGKSVVTFQQPQVAHQEQLAAPLSLQQNLVSNQIEHHYPIQGQGLIEPYQNLPVRNYQSGQNYPGDNQVLVRNQGTGNGWTNIRGATQNVYGITGNLEDDSRYIYSNSNHAQLVLNQGEKLPQGWGTRESIGHK